MLSKYGSTRVLLTSECHTYLIFFSPSIEDGCVVGQSFFVKLQKMDIQESNCLSVCLSGHWFPVYNERLFQCRSYKLGLRISFQHPLKLCRPWELLGQKSRSQECCFNRICHLNSTIGTCLCFFSRWITMNLCLPKCRVNKALIIINTCLYAS